MKIAILQGAFLPVPPVLGGAVEKMWFALGKDFAQKGHQVIHLSRRCSDLPEEESIDGVFHKRLRGYSTPSSGIQIKWLDLKYTLRATAAIPVDADIIVTNTFWAPLMLPKTLTDRCVVDVQRMPKGQMRFYKKAYRLRANSSAVARAIRQELPQSQHGKVKTIPNPLPFQNVSEVDFQSKKKIILYTGRIHPEKGLEILINAFKNTSPEWKLNIIGPADIKAGGGGIDYLHKLKTLAENFNIEFIEPVYDINLLNSFYREATIFIYPSVAEQGETFGLAPLEAMAWGCVPIVSDLTCFRDFVTHEKNGLVFDHRNVRSVELLKDCIERLQKDIYLRYELSKKALTVRDSHSTSFISSLFLADFENIISKI